MTAKVGSVVLLVVLFCLAASGIPAAAQEREVQDVYGITPWTGKEYGGAFAPKNIDTIYLLADVDNVLDALQTEVYYWPITDEYMANWYENKVVIAGSLQVFQDGKLFKVLERQPCVQFYADGLSGGAPVLIVGAAAEKAYLDYESAIDQYLQAASNYRGDYVAYEKQMIELLKGMGETGKLYLEDELPALPRQPVAPREYVTNVVEGFVLNLPVGDYELKTVDPGGSVIPGTEKRLRIFSGRRSGVGYQIIPESKWTRPVESDDLTEILYLEGARTMYLKAFWETEYNQHDYWRMTSPAKPLAGKGGESAFMWVHEEEVSDLTVQVLQGGQVVQAASAQPYLVRQRSGYALGYDIVEFDPDSPATAGKDPTFTAVKLTLEPGSYQIRVLDARGQVLQESVREIRSVRVPSDWLLVLLCLLPACLGLVVVLWRRHLHLKTP